MEAATNRVQLYKAILTCVPFIQRSLLIEFHSAIQKVHEIKKLENHIHVFINLEIFLCRHPTTKIKNKYKRYKLEVTPRL